MAGAALKANAVQNDVRLIGGNINGRYTLSGEEGLRAFACRAQSISPSAIALSAPVSGKVGDSVALHFDDFGFLKGRITRLRDFGFMLDVLADEEERARIASKIRWLKKHAARTAADARAHRRSRPRSPRSSLLRADGTKVDCFLMDVSPAGASVSADHRPSIGEALAVGRVVGRVTRLLEVGFAVQFVKLHNMEELDVALRRID